MLHQRVTDFAGSEARWSALAVLAAAALTALAAQAAIPFEPVPGTLQTMAVLGTACALGARRGAAAQLLYLAVGAAGAPVFAEGRSGLSGPTVGYLLGFVVAAYVAGAICDRFGRRFVVTVPAMVVASVPLYALGVTWLKYHLSLPWAVALSEGLTKFLAGDAAKILAAAALLDPAAPWNRLAERLRR
jgi:biotin transport system substrate-specific component